MPQRRNAIKALRQNRTRFLHNLDFKTDLKKTIKKFLSSVTQKNKEEAQGTLKLVYKKLDKAINRHLIHRNTVARRKARFAKLLNSIA